MPRNSGFVPQIAGAVALVIAAAGAPALAAALGSAPTAPPAASDLDALRRKCIAATRAAQQLERTVAALAHDADLLGRDAAGRQRGLDESRVEQAELLGEIERFARHPPNRNDAVAATPIDRLRGEMLLAAVVPALRAEVAALTGEIERIATLRAQAAAKETALAAARAVLTRNREDLAKLIAERLALDRRLAPPDAGIEAQIAKAGHEAKDVGDLLQRADAATDRHDKELVARARPADATRPRDLRSFESSFSVLTAPVAGTISRRFGAADPSETANQGLAFAALSGAEIVAPFDGRVVYAGPYGDFGLILIIRHGGLYHSLLAGLGRVDVRIDGWVVAGEPVGAMPEASGSVLYMELRREGRPVDPQPWLAARDEERSGGPEGKPEAGDQKVRE